MLFEETHKLLTNLIISISQPPVDQLSARVSNDEDVVGKQSSSLSTASELQLPINVWVDTARSNPQFSHPPFSHHSGQKVNHNVNYMSQ